MLAAQILPSHEQLAQIRQQNRLIVTASDYEALTFPDWLFNASSEFRMPGLAWEYQQLHLPTYIYLCGLN